MHVCNEIIRFYFFRSTLKSYIQIEISTIFIIKYDFIRIFIIRSDNSKKIFHFQNVVYCLKFVVNLISIYMLRKKNIHFDSKINLLYKRVLINRQQICSIFWINHFSCFQHQEIFIKLILLIIIVLHAFSKNDAWLWHTRMKHSKSMNLQKLKTNNLKMKLIDFFITDCETCIKIKITRQISRRSFDQSVIKKFQKLHINWFDFSKMLTDYMKMLFVIDWFIDLIMSYFMTTIFNETKNLRILKNVTAWIIKKKLRIEIIRSNKKLHRKKIIKWMQSVKIDFEFSISRTQTQNEFVKRLKNVIIKKIKAMTIISKISVDLWKKSLMQLFIYITKRSNHH